MSSAEFLGCYLLTSIIAGLVGAVGMAAVLHGISRSPYFHTPMITALGSLFTGSKQNALLLGGLIHSFSGIFFGLLYTLAAVASGIQGGGSLVAFGAGVGFLHGIVISILLIMLVSQNHPLEEFRRAGIGVAFAHLLAHVVFGLLVGLVIAISGFVAVVP